MPVPNDISVLAPWKLVDESDRERLASELNREISANHALGGSEIQVCARRADRDDILVAIEGCHKPLAVVHLTWRKEIDPKWPTTRFFSSWADWVETEMLSPHQELKAKS